MKQQITVRDLCDFALYQRIDSLCARILSLANDFHDEVLAMPNLDEESTTEILDNIDRLCKDVRFVDERASSGAYAILCQVERMQKEGKE